MHPLLEPVETNHTPQSLAEELQGESGVVLLESALLDSRQARYSFVAARPFLTFRSFGSRCECPGSSDECREMSQPRSSSLDTRHSTLTLFGNPWHVLESLMSRYELLDQMDLPFPLGGCFGYWGYNLKNFVEPKLPRRAGNDLELPDCHLGFYDSLVAFDHHLGKTWVISTGLDVDGSRNAHRAQRKAGFWRQRLTATRAGPGPQAPAPRRRTPPPGTRITSTFSRPGFIAAVEQAQRYIRAGDIYQVNLAQRLAAPCPAPAWQFFQRLAAA